MSRIRRRQFLGAAVALLAVPCSALAQPRGKPYRIGYLSLHPGPVATSKSFLQGLRDLGYIEGPDFVVEYRWAAGKTERLPELASDLAQAKVDIIVTAGTPATLAAKHATQTIPIVFGSAGDPVEKGIVVSLARPGGNVTGLSHHVGLSKHLEILKQAVPTLSGVAFLHDPSVYAPTEYLEAALARIDADARSVNVTVQPVRVRDAVELEHVFREFARRRPQGLVIESGGAAMTGRERLCALALQHGLPAIGRGRWYAEAGCLLSYGEDFVAMYRRAATYVHKILKGARPLDLPVDQPGKFELVINLKTAKALGMTIAPAILLRADEVIE